VPELRELVEPALQEYKIVPGLRNQNYCFRRQRNNGYLCIQGLWCWNQNNSIL